MATEDAENTWVSEFNVILDQMKHENKAKRRKALEKFNEMVFGTESNIDERRLEETLKFSVSILISLMSDQSETNRISASNVVLKFIKARVFHEINLVEIIPIFYHRLATTPQIEESEDVRLLYINILQEFIECFQDKLIVYMNDIVNILKVSVLDACPEVRKAASECVSLYANASKEKFHMQSESLVKPLLRGLNHQRFKNRIACINAIGDLLLYGDGIAIKEAAGPLAQCAMDLPQVRLVLVGVGGKLAMEMPDRYSYWQYCLPLLLFGLNDEDIDVKSKATMLWSAVGKQFEMENEDQLKEEIDFDVVNSNFPAGETRSCVGCRTIVKRSLYHILPGLLTDIDDWKEKPRLQAAKLLTTLVLNSETGITQYAEKIMVALHLAAGDKEQDTVQQVILCSKYLGHFIPPTTYLPLVLPRLSNGEYGERPLKILTALCQGSSDELVAVEVTTIVQTISAEDVAYRYDTDHQRGLLELIAVIIQKCNIQDNSYSIFCTLLFIASSSEYPHVVKLAQEQFSALAIKNGLEDVENLFQKHLKTVLIDLKSSADSWQEHTPQFQMFIGLLELSGQSLGEEMENVLDIVCCCTSRKRDPFVSLRCLMKMQQLLVKDEFPSQYKGNLGKHLAKFVSECILSFLPWHAGRTSASLRTAALNCCLSLCKVNGVEKHLKNEVKSCLDLIPALIEDEAEDTRLLSCDVIQVIRTNYPELIDSDTHHKLADKLMKRLDDIQATIRVRAANVLLFLFSNLPANYDASLQSARLRDLYERTMIFLDDPDLKLQEAVLNALTEMGKVSPVLLTELLEKGYQKYRNKHHCTSIIENLKKLSIKS